MNKTFVKGGLNTRDLSEISQLSLKKNIPILLIVSQRYCPFCDKLKEEIIHPMQISGDYEDKVVMVEILLDDFDTILNFDGSKTDPSDVARHYKVWVTPTLLFLNYEGKEVQKRMLGVNTIEMFGHYLDEALAESLTAIQNNDKSYLVKQNDIKGDAPGADQM